MQHRLFKTAIWVTIASILNNNIGLETDINQPLDSKKDIFPTNNNLVNIEPFISNTDNNTDKHVDNDENNLSLKDAIENRVENSIPSILDLFNSEKETKDPNNDGIIDKMEDKIEKVYNYIKEGYDKLMNRYSSKMEDILNDSEKKGQDTSGKHVSKKIEYLYNHATDMYLNDSYSFDKLLVYKCHKNYPEDKIYVIELELPKNLTLFIIKDKKLNVEKFKDIELTSKEYKTNIIIPAKACSRGYSIIMCPEFKDDKTKIKMYTADNITVEFNDTVNVVSHFTDRINILVKNDFNFMKENINNRLQFILQTNLAKHDIKSDQYLHMLINKNGEFPTMDNYQMRATGNMGDGLIKTISQTTGDACKHIDCNYQVSIYTNKISQFLFFPVVFANGSEIKLDDNIVVIEELESSEELTYKIVAQLIDSSLVFEIIPTQADVFLYINPNDKPIALKDYKYILTNEGVKNIVVNDKDIKANKNGECVLYVTFTAKNPGQTSTFKFTAEKVKNHDVLNIKEDYTVLSRLKTNQLRQFYLDLQSNKEEDYSLQVHLIADAPQLNIIVKECLPEEKKCVIDSSDILNIDNISQESIYNDRIFKAATIKEGDLNRYEKIILLDFTCQGTEKMHKKPKKYNVAESKLCKFVVGVDSSKVKPNIFVSFKLKIEGQNQMNYIYPRKATTIVTNSAEIKNFAVSVDSVDIQNFKFMKFKVISISGSSKIFISKTNENPNDNDFDAYIDITNDNYTSINAKLYETFLELENLMPNKEIYISVRGIEYAILQVYIEFSNTDNDDVNSIHYLHENIIMHEKITANDIKTFSNKQVYSKEFLFNSPPAENMADSFQITLNSNHLGLALCIQINAEELNVNGNCDYYSEDESLTIPEIYDNSFETNYFLISVQKVLNEENKTINLPINFSISASANMSNELNNTLIPGQPFTKLLKKNKSTNYQINIQHMKDKGLILFLCDHSSVKAILRIMNESYTSVVATLDQYNFAVRINDIAKFINKYAIHEDTNISIEVSNKSSHDYRITILFVADEKPILLKEGTHIHLPADLNQYFIFEPSVNDSLYFSAISSEASGITYSKIVDEAELQDYNLNDLLDGSHFDFKSDLSQNMQITIRPTSLSKYDKPYACFLYSPKMNYRLKKDVIVLYNTSDSLKVGLHSQIKHLKENQQTEGKVSKGEFDYFYFVVDEAKGFSIILSVEAGEADVYLNKGMFNFTTLNHYWKRRVSYKNDELVITKDMFKHPNDIIGTYTVGVYAKKSAIYSISFLPEFANIIRIRYQHLIHLKIKPETYYYFDYFNTHEVLGTYFYAMDATVDLSLLNFDEREGQDFIDVIKDENNYIYNHTFHNGDPPIANLSKNETDLKSHYIVRVKARSRKTDFNIAIFNPQEPIITPASKRFYFVQESNKKQMFKTLLDNEYEEVDVIVNIAYGSISFKISDYLGFNGEAVSLKGSDQKEIPFRVISDEKNNDILLFKEIYILVESEEFSSYSILIKPKNSFIELKPSKIELIKTSTEYDSYCYFSIEKSDVATFKSLSIQMKSMLNIDGKPELLFMSDDNISLNEDSVFLPMPLIDYIENSRRDFIEYEIKPEIIPGIYIIKFPKMHTVSSVKIDLIYNDERHLGLNSYTHVNALHNQNTNHSYSIYIPEPGDLRLILDTCSEASIENVRFDNTTDFSMQDNVYQSHNFIIAKSINGRLRKEMVKITQPLKRIVVDKKGLLTFNINISDTATDDKVKVFKDYYILSEFISNEETLVLKDYIDVFSHINDFKKLTIRNRYIDYQAQLEISTKLPKIKDQLYQDYPNFKKVVFKVHYFLHADKNFMQNFQLCGIDAIRHTKHTSHLLTKEFRLPLDNYFDDKILLTINRKDLDEFKDKNSIKIFSYISVYFYEKEEEEFGISLNTKFAIVPYMLLSLPNSYEDTITIFLTFFMIFTSVICLLILIIYWKCNDKDEGQRNIYEPANNISRINENENRLEMSEIRDH